MIVGVGIDITSVDRVAERLKQNRTSFLAFLLSSDELERLARVAPPREAMHVAGRWASKEAVLKVLKGGIGRIALHEIQVVPDSSGCPCVRLVGHAASIAEELGARRWHVSISHERDYAVAIAIAETGGPPECRSSGRAE